MYSRVYVEITNICNRNCSFCHGHSRPLRQMDQEAFAYILDQLTGITGYIYYHLMGEPLTHKQLPLFLSMAKQRGFRSVITTNGTLLPNCGPALLSAGLHKVFISIHSFEGTDQNAHEQYLSGAARFAEEAVQHGTIVVFRLWNKGRDEGRNDTVLSYLRSHINGEWKENSKGFRIRQNLYLEYGDRFEWPDLAAPFQGEDVFCYGLRDHFGILCDGTVVPCCLDSEGAIPLGNIFQENISSILQSPRAEAMRHGFDCRTASEELCRRCGYARRFAK